MMNPTRRTSTVSNPRYAVSEIDSAEKTKYQTTANQCAGRTTLRGRRSGAARKNMSAGNMETVKAAQKGGCM
jgi:hypothetical protein